MPSLRWCMDPIKPLTPGPPRTQVAGVAASSLALTLAGEAGSPPGLWGIGGPGEDEATQALSGVPVY